VEKQAAMSEQDEPTQKLCIYPRPYRVVRKPLPVALSEPYDLPPMPAWEELTRPDARPLILPGDADDTISRQPTLPLDQVVSSPVEAGLSPSLPVSAVRSAALAGDAATRGWQKLQTLIFQQDWAKGGRRRSDGKRRALRGSRSGPTRLRRRRRPRCITLALLLLLSLVVLGGLVVSGLYALETTVLAPLAQFFHPLGGDSDGAIDGRPWNLLLLGSDNDRKFVFPAVLTQVMMVVHVDPLNKRVFMLSIPRDSWVAVPGQTGMHKIDQAFYMGAAEHHSFDDGVRLARATIEQDYGISIDRYAWIGLGGFASVIDTVGGIDIDVRHPLLDDNYPDDTGPGTRASNPYALKRLLLAPGPQHLTGEQALEYVRSRHADLVGDIGRTQRQQEVLEALKKKLDVSTIFNHLAALFHDLTGKVYTDLSEQEMLSVANFARELPAGAIERLTLGPGRGSKNYGSLATINDPGLDASQDIILPNCATIQPVINRIFDLGDAQSCRVNGS
jgi:LCP family protein required for cell wall assembly